MNMSEEKLKYALEHADGWVVRNLRSKHNSVFPSALITCEADIRAGQKMLSIICGTPVTIRKTEGGYICEL